MLFLFLSGGLLSPALAICMDLKDENTFGIAECIYTQKVLVPSIILLGGLSFSPSGPA